ncbi:GNAT family N-acetyltransferase [Rhodanobacter lindaniclasticus]
MPGIGDAQAFLRRAFVDGAGEFGWRNHVVGELDGVVVAAGAGYGGATKWPFTRAAARQILGHYGWRRAAGVIGRGLRVESVIPPPTGNTYYLGHFGVSPSLRGQGVGSALVGHLLAARPGDRAGPVILDVATTNPAAQRLYQRLGFAVVGERASTLVNAQGRVAGSPAHAVACAGLRFGIRDSGFGIRIRDSGFAKSRASPASGLLRAATPVALANPESRIPNPILNPGEELSRPGES